MAGGIGVLCGTDGHHLFLFDLETSRLLLSLRAPLELLLLHLESLPGEEPVIVQVLPEQLADVAADVAGARGRRFFRTAPSSDGTSID